MSRRSGIAPGQLCFDFGGTGALEHSACRFCGRDLHDRISRRAGYGRVCASKRGLGWRHPERQGDKCAA
jgi:hypothetical protein